jgi:hypothetical protein
MLWGASATCILLAHASTWSIRDAHYGMVLISKYLCMTQVYLMLILDVGSGFKTPETNLKQIQSLNSIPLPKKFQLISRAQLKI